MRRDAVERAMAGVAILFFVKAALLALFVTPLWDVPDETGHYAIVQDLADGRGLPLPGRSFVGSDVMARWIRKGQPAAPMLNWVAQHPPLYHLVAVPFLLGARAVTDDPEWLWRAPRLLSAISGALALLLFFRVFREAGADPLLAFTASAAIGFVPTFTHLSSGTNHDVFLAATGGVAALCWLRLLQTSQFRDGLKMGAALALMGAVKLSALPVAAALLLLSWPRLAARGWRRLLQWSAVAAVSFSLPALWALRHWWLLGNTRVHPVSSRPFDLGSFFSYLRAEPVVDHTFKNFVGLIGCTGSGGGDVRWFQISGVFLAPYLLLALAACLGAAAWLLRAAGGRGRALAGAAAAAVFLGCFVWLFAGGDGAEPLKRVVYSLLVSVPFLALPLAFRREEPEAAAIGGANFVFLVFSLAFLVNSWGAFQIYGQMRATNGRYFLAILPFLAMAFVFPAARLARPGPWRDRALLLLLAALFAVETAFFLLRVIPFYRAGVP